MSGRSIYPAILITAAFLIGCNDNTTEPIEEETNTLLPLAVGNTWNYKLYNQSSDSIGQITWNISNKVVLDGFDSEEYFLINSSGLDNIYFAAQNKTDGLFLSVYDSINGFTSPFFISILSIIMRLINFKSLILTAS